MIIRIQMTDTQLAARLAELGYETETKDIPVAVSKTHGLTEIEQYPRLHVKEDGKWTEAHPFFEQLLDKSLMYMIKSYTAQIKLNIV